MNLNLDIARGLAALGVFLFHIKEDIAFSMPIVAKIAKFGSLGVPLFFVISGYVITASAETSLRHDKAANSFLKRRFLRIYPPFWLSVIVVIALPYIIAAISLMKSGQYEMPSPSFTDLGWLDWVELLSLTRVFSSTDGDLVAQFNQVNSVYWTLAIEFQFYLCIYFSLIFRKYFYLIIIGITFISYLLLAFPLRLNAGLFIHFWPMFSVGIVLYYTIANNFTVQRLFPRIPIIIALLIILPLLFSVLLYSYLGKLTEVLTEYFPSSYLGFAVVSALVLWAANPLEKTLERFKQGKSLFLKLLIKSWAFLGVISYSLYLLHAKLALLTEMFIRQFTSPHNYIYPVLVICSTVALCSVFYWYAERPFMSKKQRRIYQTILTE
jgi:peptidoglycan/LPS O-acetylase OafA/YrhL